MNLGTLAMKIGAGREKKEDGINYADVYKRQKKGSTSHSAWLMFMYPRLQLARDLLDDDGVIFISIDDNEQGNLKLICDDVFGEQNFAGQIAVVNNLKGRNDRNWTADFNWLMNSGNMAKVLEGKYTDNRQQAPGRQQTKPERPGRVNTMDVLAGIIADEEGGGSL